MNLSRNTAIVCLALLVVGAASAQAGEQEQLATYSLTGADGNKTTLSSYRGEVVVVNFWASWCKPCRKELPVMNQWHTEWSDRGARVVAISVDKEARKARTFAEKVNLTLDVFHDGPNGLAKSLDLPSLPCTFLLDRDGKVVTVIQSSSDKDLAKLHSKVESLLRTPQKADATSLSSAVAGDGGSQ